MKQVLVTTATIIVMALIVAAAIGANIIVIRAIANSGDHRDCKPVSYVNGLWLNDNADIIGEAPTEDSKITYLGDCMP